MAKIAVKDLGAYTIYHLECSGKSSLSTAESSMGWFEKPAINMMNMPPI